MIKIVKALFVHSYCLAESGQRLTVMSLESVTKAAEQWLAGDIDYVILAAAYHVWAKEADLKKGILKEFGVDMNKVIVIPRITSTYDEIEGVRQIVTRLGITELEVIADKWHAPRSRLVFQKKFPNLTVIMKPFTPTTYERALEPHRIKILGWIKSFRIGYAPTWILWNMLLWFLTPVILRWHK